MKGAAIMESTPAQAFAKQMAVLEEKIKDHVQSTLSASEEKSARLHDSLLRFLERADGDVLRRTREEPYLNPRRRLDLDDYERGGDTGVRNAAAPATKRRTVVTTKGKEPVDTEARKKGAVASCSKQGVIDFALEVRGSLQAKQALELKLLCKRKNITWVSKAQAVKDLAAAETREAYDGWLTGADDGEGRKEDRVADGDVEPHAD
ncbi:hypothetical protein CBR_g20071 [Chara braunii]|uniref:Uncharacterized protein n=1 Tax=Chara braunii TaxID=69332 RepID=A0A388KZI4_CHABU|nr:hypothetical protein CBR_g20071 [Chara braunii]|eukprot:GBG75441.1 hypothetical protein CBR_g20071 [Chara braunii]